MDITRTQHVFVVQTVVIDIQSSISSSLMLPLALLKGLGHMIKPFVLV